VLPLLLSAAFLRATEVPITVQLLTSVASPQPVGTPIGLTSSIGLESLSRDMFVFQYSVSVNGGPFRIVRDFSQPPSFVWTPDLFEQTATVRVRVRNNETKATGQAEVPFQIVSRTKGSASVTHTSHPLVALFSAPPCPTGSQFRVAFHAEGEESVSRTPNQPCRGSISSNVYVAGMRADTEYRLRSEVSTGGNAAPGDWLPFRTGILDGNFPAVTIQTAPPAGYDDVEPVIIFSALSFDGNGRPFATDLQGRVIWYLRSRDWITRVIPGGRFLTLGDGMNSVNSAHEGQVLRELDLAGNIVRETNIGRVAEQLESRGIHSDCHKAGRECVGGFHHEAIRLPNGHTLTVAGIERMMPTGTQGSKLPVDVLGDVVIDLDDDFQVDAVWNSFDHMDLNRKSLNEAKCQTGGGDGCPAVLLADEANGWLHSNSLNYIPSTGDLLISMPEQNWVVKIDWKDGKGSGKVLWRLGKDGDFTTDSKDPNPWFSFQHDAGFEPVGSDILTLTDDGDAGNAFGPPAPGSDPKAQKPKPGVRAQVWKLDEQKHVATLLVNAPLGVNTICCGSMQVLKNGGYSAVGGWSLPVKGRTTDFDKNGKPVFAIELVGAADYRSYRVADMYSAPIK
jgi:hypothetical protein